MFRLLLISILSWACASALPSPAKKTPLPMPDGRIVGGENVNIEDFPHQVSLLWFRIHACGGSIISLQHVVTAAHCTNAKSASQFSVRAGSARWYSGGEVIGVSAIYQHPNFGSWTAENDISVLVLTYPVKVGPGINYIRLPQQDQEIPVGVDAVVSGWGATSEEGWLSSQLQAVTVSTISLAECQQAYDLRNVTERMLCAGFPEGGKDACQGDSGGPLIIGSELIGVVSWGLGCARPNFPGVYASVPALRDFIEEVLSY